VKITKRPRIYSLREIYEKRKKILIKRDVGGLGDILMHRMIFEDFKILMPDACLTFACPAMYHPAVWDHPFIDKVVDCREVEDHIIAYNTSSICGRYELQTAPHCDKHRGDIWAEYCGVNLTRHNMHIRLTEEEIAFGSKYKDAVIVTPISAMLNKNLEPSQINPVIEKLGEVYTLHTCELPEFGVPTITGLSIREWMSVIHGCKHLISVDTAAFHCRGGMGKSAVGIFGWADSKVYAKYYPRVELVQRHREDEDWPCGPCYNFVQCPKCPQEVVRKPCITSITPEMILEKFQNLVDKYPNA
jgi:hypothetical protein